MEKRVSWILEDERVALVGWEEVGIFWENRRMIKKIKFCLKNFFFFAFQKEKIDYKIKGKHQKRRLQRDLNSKTIGLVSHLKVDKTQRAFKGSVVETFELRILLAERRLLQMTSTLRNSGGHSINWSNYLTGKCNIETANGPRKNSPESFRLGCQNCTLKMIFLKFLEYAARINE